MEKKRCLVLICLVPVFLFFSLRFVFSESGPGKRPGPSKSPSYSAYSKDLFGRFWCVQSIRGGLVFSKEENAPRSMVLRMRRLFEFEREKWLKKGFKNPFENSGIPPDTADRMWFDQWLAVQLMILMDKGWSLAAMRGDEYVFTARGPVSKEIPTIWSSHEEEPPVFPEPTYPGHCSFPMHGSGPNWHAHFAGYYLMIPPPAASLRIYAPQPINATFYRFLNMPYLHIPQLANAYFRVHWDSRRYNVIRIDFIKNDRQGLCFWAWQLLRLRLQPAARNSKGEWGVFDWLAWEFLDEDGKPLPADYPLPTRWFPDNFEEIFKPIPLPEELENLPEAQE